jgi:hypothetical protein
MRVTSLSYGPRKRAISWADPTDLGFRSRRFRNVTFNCVLSNFGLLLSRMRIVCDADTDANTWADTFFAVVVPFVQALRRDTAAKKKQEKQVAHRHGP